ncbi:MAG: hypothetical protein J4F39_00975 [Candidatus Latescibacteria bacterium]|nr:hypothetical protein [Candidatus Latescibacterota bacterium]
MSDLIRSAFAIAVLAICVPKTEATTVERFGFDSLCDRAETIAHVQCVSRTSFKDDGRGEIVTRHRFRVIVPVKGNPGDEIVLTLPGGTADGRRLYIPGIPEFGVDEEVVLFLTAPDKHGSPWPMGLGQGCYRVIEAQDGHAQVRLQQGATPLPAGALFKPALNRPSRPFNVPLQLFIHQIRLTIPEPSDER